METPVLLTFVHILKSSALPLHRPKQLCPSIQIAYSGRGHDEICFLRHTRKTNQIAACATGGAGLWLHSSPHCGWGRCCAQTSQWLVSLQNNNQPKRQSAVTCFCQFNSFWPVKYGMVSTRSKSSAKHDT